MSNIMVEVEADGGCPGLYSMVSFGAVVVRGDLKETFYGRVKPISEKWIPEALAVSGHSREETLTFDDPAVVMKEFAEWVTRVSEGRPIFWSDNNGFDWMFINYYFHTYLGTNPFGFSSRNLNDVYKGLTKDMYASFKHLRKTKHTHHPVDDATGNAEALMTMKNSHSLKISFK